MLPDLTVQVETAVFAWCSERQQLLRLTELVSTVKGKNATSSKPAGEAPWRSFDVFLQEKGRHWMAVWFL